MNRLVNFSLACFFISAYSFGQTVVPAKDNEFDKKYTPAQSSIFNNLNRKNKENPSGGSSIDIKNSIKFSPTMLLRQKIGFFYERQVAEGFSVEFGLGKAFGRDVIEIVGLEAFTLDEEDANSAGAGLILNSGEYSGSSPLVHAGLRLYYSGESFDGGYINLFYRFERLSYTLPATMNDLRVEGSRQADFRMNSFNCGFGYSTVSGIKSNITHDFFISIGIRMYEYTKFEEAEVPLFGSYYSSERIYRATTSTNTVRLAPSINISYSLGFGF